MVQDQLMKLMLLKYYRADRARYGPRSRPSQRTVKPRSVSAPIQYREPYHHQTWSSDISPTKWLLSSCKRRNTFLTPISGPAGWTPVLSPIHQYTRDPRGCKRRRPASQPTDLGKSLFALELAASKLLWRSGTCQTVRHASVASLNRLQSI